MLLKLMTLLTLLKLLALLKFGLQHCDKTNAYKYSVCIIIMSLHNRLRTV